MTTKADAYAGYAGRRAAQEAEAPDAWDADVPAAPQVTPPPLALLLPAIQISTQASTSRKYHSRQLCKRHTRGCELCKVGRRVAGIEESLSDRF